MIRRRLEFVRRHRRMFEALPFRYYYAATAVR